MVACPLETEFCIFRWAGGRAGDNSENDERLHCVVDWLLHLGEASICAEEDWAKHGEVLEGMMGARILPSPY